MGSSKTLLLVCFALFVVLSSTVKAAVDIKGILGKHPDFSTMLDLLKKTQVDQQIDVRQSITILAVDNHAISGIAGKPVDEVKRILSVHVILDYFDDKKLQEISSSKKLTKTTTMFQATGEAINSQGFMEIGPGSDGKIAFGSSVEGSPLNAKYVKQVMTQPTDISVLQISEPIVPKGIETPLKPQKSSDL